MNSERNQVEQRLDFDNGKYTLILAKDGYTVTALRYGEPWRDFVGDKFISHLAQAVFEKAQAPTDECKCKRSGKKVSMSGGHVNKTADSLHVPTDAQIAPMTDPNSITDEQADAAQLAHYRFVFGEEGLPNRRELGIGRQAMKVAISKAVRAAFTEGNEDKP